MNTPLDVAVRAALESRRGEWKRIADQAGVSYSWISKFVNGHIPNPGFATLSGLHATLTEPPATAEKAA
jgi:transcriptional regulator with XRE-family HTH domain